MISRDRVAKGVAAYLDNEVLPQLPGDGWEKVIAGTAMGIMTKKMDHLIETLQKHPVVKAFGVIDDDGMIDDVLVMDQLREHIPDEGMLISLPLVGDMRIHKNDVDILRRYLS